ncbi:hypothetical protein HLRTI_001634 [Halorhabdus tiamatea SARL4B]|uniref:Conserved hypothetical membrane protein n=1 Tax=Halorhabdus tiamatea SARL4B TaxID=1033806 RepID=F7PG47_9EURY|nr:hypothetical protein [Halorhabdus tiamatea]ERJ06289.1 hypothetical protein HLRTI_001634 [Halorhabdus tiamatea SARL4B]CCQ34658.1 conserved hypothetical membrane protein [Halorhabdus tiamatea SARL4B]
MLPELRELFWAVAGNLVVGFGAGTATLSAFSPSLPLLDGSNPAIRVGVVSIGFAFFFAGYHLTQVGTYLDPDESFASAFVPVPDDQPHELGATDSGGVDGVLLARGGFVLVGVVGLGAGMRLFALTIQSWDATLGVAAGVVCIGGYIFGHIGINGVTL